jgi:23S rRNA (pseudouridine1915-N3)-methyltransferase
LKIRLVSVGSKMPAWVQQGVDEYAKRIIVDLGFSILEIPMAKRTRSVNIEQCIQKEGEAIIAALGKGDYSVALNVKGKQMSTEALAESIGEFRLQGRNINLIVGGPDGLSRDCLSKANEVWSLSRMTLPHPLVRIVLAEQLYRASSILKGHPYHRS